jgi:hypothetical protein
LQGGVPYYEPEGSRVAEGCQRGLVRPRRVRARQRAAKEIDTNKSVRCGQRATREEIIVNQKGSTQRFRGID